MSDLISVIVPVYNVEKYLSRCLESIINQTYKNIEVVCIDDGSPDKSINILKQYEKKDKRIKIIRQENKGLSGARNTGIKKSNGEYIFFVDSDDWLPKNAIELLYKTIEKDKSDICIGNLVKTYPKKNKEKKLKKMTNSIFTLTSYLEYSIKNKNFTANVVNKLYRSKIIKQSKILFKEKILYEDFFFVIQYFSYTRKISMIKENVYYYYLERSDSIVNNINKGDLDSFQNVADIENFLINNNHEEILNLKYFQNYIFEWLLSATVSKLFKSRNIELTEKMYELIRNNKVFKKYYKLYQKNKIFGTKKIFAMIFLYNKNLFIQIIKLKNKFFNR